MRRRRNVWSKRVLRAGRTGLVALLLLAAIGVDARANSPAVEDLASGNITIKLSQDRVSWGDEIVATVSATNNTGATLPGGLYVSFDEDVLILDVNGGKLLKTGADVYHLKRAQMHPLARPMIEAWDKAWKPGTERTVVLTLLPIGRGERVRVRARATFIAAGNPPRLHIAPGRIDSRALDDTEFPTITTYLWVSREASLRRSVRRIERRLRDLDESQQRRFAEALGTALENPKSFTDFGNVGSDAATRQASQSLLGIVPGMSELLKRDPLQALDNLRCLMASLSCTNALMYFRVPQALWAELSAEEVARLDAKRQLEKEKGGIELVALLDAEGMTYTRDKAGTIVVQARREPVRVGPAGAIVVPLLDRIIAVLGPDADTPRPEANGLSFSRLKAQLAGAPVDKK